MLSKEVLWPRRACRARVLSSIQRSFARLALILARCGVFKARLRCRTDVGTLELKGKIVPALRQQHAWQLRSMLGFSKQERRTTGQIIQ
jgi:hypothetical protein